MWIGSLLTLHKSLSSERIPPMCSGKDIPPLAAHFVHYKNPSRIAPVFLLLIIDCFTVGLSIGKMVSMSRGLITGD